MPNGRHLVRCFDDELDALLLAALAKKRGYKIDFWEL